MIYYLEIDFGDNVTHGVYSQNHKFLTIVYLSYVIFYHHHKFHYLKNHIVILVILK